jgi:hypothetical protein
VAPSSTVIAVVGEALVDLVVAPDGAITATPGGAPFNVARACARLGMPVSLIAAISTDRFGRRLTADLAADGVDDTYVQRREQPTTLALADVDPSGGVTYRFYLDGTSAPTVTATDLPAGTRALVAGGLGVAVEPMASAVEQMVVESGDNVLVLVDINYQRPSHVRWRRTAALSCSLASDVLGVDGRRTRRRRGLARVHAACTPGDHGRRLRDAWRVRSTSGPSSPSLPTTWPRFEPVTDCDHRGGR